MSKLRKAILPQIEKKENLILPTQAQLSYPERVIQFGTGVLLRGLPDQYIHDANREGKFCGRILVVKSTGKGSSDPFVKQDGLYSVCVKGVENGKTIDKTIVNASISRVLSAASSWDRVLESATDPNIQIVLSNTTEVGIVRSEDKIPSISTPTSFPGKLLDFLYKRFLYFNGDPQKGLVIVPTELIEENGTKLKKILNDLALYNHLDEAFLSWLNEDNHICNSLVDRIVPGRMAEEHHLAKENILGYEDELMIMAEPFGLWVIESSSPIVRQVLSFADEHTGCIVVPSIDKFKEIKLRLLNGTHTFSCGVALLSGIDLVREAMQDAQVSSFVKSLIKEEIAPCVISEDITASETTAFAERVIDRFSNPFIDHKWESISAQFTSKMKMRNLPLFSKSVDQWGKVPRNMVIGFSAYLLCMHTKADDQGNFLVQSGVKTFALTDGFAASLHQLWTSSNKEEAIKTILSEESIWGEDLNRLPGFMEDVLSTIYKISSTGIRSVL